MSQPAETTIRTYGEDTVANGDPYMAMLMETNEQGVAIQRRAVSLGTGFTSMDDIASFIRLELRRDEPALDGFRDLSFEVDSVDIFGVVGRVDM